MRTRNAFAVISLLTLLPVMTLLVESCRSATNQSSSTPTTTQSSLTPVTTQPLESLDIKPLDGKEVYETMCLPCHLTQCDAPGDISGSGLPEQTVTEAIMWGTGGMPAFQDTFTAEQRYLIVAYVTGGSKGTPPPEIGAAGPTAFLYWDKCSGCHGLERQGGTGPALVPQRLEGIDGGVLKNTISDGRSGTAMPPWKGILTDCQRRV